MRGDLRVCLAVEELCCVLSRGGGSFDVVARVRLGGGRWVADELLRLGGIN